MRYPEFSRIAEEEASLASQADGVDYFLRTAPADEGMRTSISIHVLHPKSGESLSLFSTPREPADMPALTHLTEESARELVRKSLSAARANRNAEMYLEEFLRRSRGREEG